MELDAHCRCISPDDPVTKFDVALLADALRAEHFVWSNDPARYPSFTVRWIGGSLLLGMPVGDSVDPERARALVVRLHACGDAFRQARGVIGEPSPLALRTAEVEARELSVFVNQLTSALIQQMTADRQFARDATAAAASATEGIRAFSDHLRYHVRPGDVLAYQDGELWSERTRLSEGVTASPDEILELALAEMARLQDELAQPLAAKADEQGDAWGDDELGGLDCYLEAVQRARAFGRSLGWLPQTTDADSTVVAAMPAWLATTYRVAVIAPPPMEPGRKGGVMLIGDIPDNGDAIRQRAQRLLSAAHEVWPGHCLHASYRQQCTSLVRRLLRFRTCSEGWACYVEEPIARATGCSVTWRVAIEMALLRAVRAWADVLVHVHGISYEQAADAFSHMGLLDAERARQEALRICLEPATGFAYLYGKDRIRTLINSANGAAETVSRVNRFLSFGMAPIDAFIAHTRAGEADRPVARAEDS